MIRRYFLILVVFFGTSSIAQSPLNYVPTQMAAFTSPDGTGSATSWSALTSTGGLNALSFVPTRIGIYYSNDGTGNIGTWVPWTGAGGGGGGGTGTVTNVSFGSSLNTIFSVTAPTTTPVINAIVQSANTFFAAPSGASGVPIFRAIVPSDVPTLNQSTTGNAATATSASSVPASGVTGVLAAANGGTGNTTGTAANALALNGAAIPINSPLLGTNSLGQAILVGGANPFCAGAACPSQSNNLFTTASPLTLTVAMTAGDTSLTVSSTTGFPSVGCGFIPISGFSESICWSGSTSTTLTGLTRGFYATTASSKTVGAQLFGYIGSQSLSTSVAPAYVIGNNGAISYGTAAIGTANPFQVFGTSSFTGAVAFNGGITAGTGAITGSNGGVPSFKLIVSSGQIAAKQINTSFYVGNVTNLAGGAYASIQSAVTAAVAAGGGRVIIPKAVTPTDTIGVVTGGSNTVPVLDENFLPTNQYSWNGSAYSLLPSTQLALAINKASGGNEFYGDSLFAAQTGVGDSGLYLQMGSRLANDLLGISFNNAVGGTRMSQIVQTMYANHQPNLSPTSVATIITDGGVNEANFDGSSTGALNNFMLEFNAFIAWGELSAANRVMASVAAPSGTWVASTLQPLSSQTTGTARSSTTNASTLTFSTTGTGTKVGVTYYAPLAANGGTFTFSIDGTPQTNVCSGTTTFANTGCNGFAVAGTSYTVFRQEFTVAAGAHSAVVTVTSATSASNIVYIAAVDQTPATKTSLPILIHAGVIREQADGNSVATAAYNTAVQTVFSAMSWANTFFVDTRTGTPGVNTTTDMAANGNTSPCPGGNAPLHPNKCGYDNWVTTVENTAAIAALNIFYPGINTPANNVIASQVVNGSSTTVGVNQAQNYQSPLQTTSRLATSPTSWLLTASGVQASNSALWTQPLCFLFGNVSCIDLSFDTASSSLMTALISEFDMGFQQCPHGVATGSITTGPTACTTVFKVNATTKAATLYGNTTAPTVQLGTTTQGTCAAGLRGQLQYTAGATGVVDLAQACTKDAADVYAWRSIIGGASALVFSGSGSVAAASTTATVSDTNVTSTSAIVLTFDASLGPALGVTCNTIPSVFSVAARTPGTGFTVTTATPTTNPACFSYIMK